jgi:type IX secretion system PorP/SprF family membrane protein
MVKIFYCTQVLVIFFSCFTLQAQNYPVYSSFYINPYLYNPAETATEYTYAFANYRKQWLSVPGSPSLSTVNFNTLIDQSRTGIGAKISSYKRGLLNSTDVLFSFAHGVPLYKESILYLGMSGGFISNGIDVDGIVDPSDPAIANYQSNNFQPAANAGIKWSTSTGFHLGAALPVLFGSVFQPEELSAPGIMPFDNLLFSFSYKKKVEKKAASRNKSKSPGHRYEPFELHTLYRFSVVGNNQFEVLAKYNFSDNLWLAASYRQKYGVLGSLGLAFDRYLICYSYELGNQPQDGFSRGTHEVQIGVRLSDEKRFKFKVPVLQSTLKTNEVRHDPRYHTETIDDEEAAASKTADKKRYYVFIRAFTDFVQAEKYMRTLIDQKYNAQIFYYQKDKRYYVYTFESPKEGEANSELRKLKEYTKLKGAKVLVVTEK